MVSLVVASCVSSNASIPPIARSARIVTSERAVEEDSGRVTFVRSCRATKAANENDLVICFHLDELRYFVEAKDASLSLGRRYRNLISRLRESDCTPVSWLHNSEQLSASRHYKRVFDPLVITFLEDEDAFIVLSISISPRRDDSTRR